MPDRILLDKLDRVDHIESQEPHIVDLKSCISIHVPPQAKHASFPYHDFTPYCQALTRGELLKELG